MPRPADSAPADTPTDTSAGERIAKLLARAGVASRREVERMIVEGRVARDGVAIDTPATVLASLHGVTVDGQPVAQPAPARLFLYHKPTGLLVTERDPRGRPTIYDRLPDDLPRVVPVGRLDLNTEGLLLLTTDGGLKRQLELPATGVERAYRARCYGQVSQAQLETLMEGIEIEGVRYGPINANLERRTGANTWVEMILTEGKNREVRRVLEHLGLQVGRLIRTRYGPFILGDLPPGAVGEVRQADLVAFRQTLAGKRRSEERIAVQAASAAPSRARRASLPSGERRGPVAPKPDAPMPAQTPIRRAARSAPAAAKLHPREGGGPVATNSVGAARRPSRPQGTAIMQASEGPKKSSRSSGSPLDPRLRGGGTQRARLTESSPTKSAEPTAPTTRSPKPPLRKTGWAKPKPKAGPRRPGKR